MVSLIRLLFAGALAYLGLKIFASAFKSSKTAQVKGKAQTKPIDLSKEDVEDVEFEETKD
jgi:hypothetical protein